MSAQSQEVQLALLEQAVKMIQKSCERIEDNQEKDRVEVRKYREEVTDMSRTLTDLKEQFADSKLTLKEFKEARIKVIAAGKFGKWVWAFLFGTLTTVVWFKDNLLQLMVGK